MAEKIPCKILDWNDVYSLTEKVAAKVKKAKYQPDIVIGLARGGWFTARLLCDFLGVKELVSLKVEHWGVTARPDGKAVIKYPFKLDLSDKKVLIVDDITDTGESMKVAADYVSQQLLPSAVRTAVLQNISKTSKYEADFVGAQVAWNWYVYPWNFFEDMRNLVPKAFEEDEELTPGQIRDRCAKLYGFRLQNDRLLEVLADLRHRKLLYKTDGKYAKK